MKTFSMGPAAGRRLRFGIVVLAAVGLSFVSGGAGGVTRDGTHHSSKGSTGASSTSSNNSRGSKSNSRRKHSRHEPKQKVPTPQRIEEIQSALSRGGYYQGSPNGKWDSSTVEAMRRFQQEHGISPTGKLDAQSLQKLGLGSDIAGLGAPREAPQVPPAAIVTGVSPSAPPAPKRPLS
jgi:peptidoglycan hydrolase-like protein with peptidoglycan-binding domain